MPSKRFVVKVIDTVLGSVAGEPDSEITAPLYSVVDTANNDHIVGQYIKEGPASVLAIRFNAEVTQTR